jgi:hypothetical protein
LSLFIATLNPLRRMPDLKARQIPPRNKIPIVILWPETPLLNEP